MKRFYVDTVQGCAIYHAKTLDEAKTQALKDVGRLNFKSIRKATQEDITWIQGMGGKVDD